MSADDELQLRELLREAANLEDGPSKIALLEDAVRLADHLNDDELGYQIRQHLIRAATFTGAPEKALVAFSWCLAQCDRQPDRFFEADLLWKYKWAMDSVAGFVQVPRPKIDEMLQDMERRFRRSGASLRPVYKLQCKVALDMGDREAAQAAQPRWQAAPRDEHSDCAACERNDEVRYLIFLGQDERAVQHAVPILRGTLRCAEIPHWTYGRVLLPLVRLGRLDEAMRYHQQGYRMVARNRDFLPVVAAHLSFLVLTANHAPAVQLLERHLLWALEAPQQAERFEFYLAARFLLQRLQETGQTSLALRLPRTFPLYQEEGHYEVSVLAEWFDTALRDLASRFDARNGNDFFSRRVAENQALRELVSPFPLPVPAKVKDPDKPKDRGKWS